MPDTEAIYSYICINKNNNSIYSVSSDSLRQVRFINTNVSCFGESLSVYRKTQMAVEARQNDDEFIDREIETLKARLIEIDPKVFDSEENWWTSIFSGIYG